MVKTRTLKLEEIFEMYIRNHIFKNFIKSDLESRGLI